jgi:hypothetical protein
VKAAYVADFHAVIPCGILFWGNSQAKATGMPKKNNTCGIEGGTTLTSFKNTVNTKTAIVIMQKAQQLPLISVYLMMAE